MRTLLKVGGSILEPEPKLELVAMLVERQRAGEELALVHGGGKSLSRLLARLGVTSQFKRGLRVTDAATLEAAVMVLAGEVNKKLVGLLNAAGLKAVGLTGLDGDCVRASVADTELGLVGEVDGGDPTLLRTLIDSGFIPVLAPLAADGRGGALNVNADQFAAACAADIGADRLLFYTDVAGVLDRAGRTIPEISLDELEAMERVGAVSGGMLPKLDACREALLSGVPSVEIAGLQGAGTRVVAVQGSRR